MNSGSLEYTARTFANSSETEFDWSIDMFWTPLNQNEHEQLPLVRFLRNE